MKTVPMKIRKLVEDRIVSDVAKLNAHYNLNLAVPAVAYDCRGLTAGCVKLKDGWSIIHLNPILLIDNVDEMVNQTTPHELAHWADHKINGEQERSFYGKRSIHGHRWKAIMHVIGVSPDRCHSMDTSKAQIRVKNKFEYRCDCGKVMSVGPVVHKKILNGQKRWHCTGRKFTFVRPLGQMTYTQISKAREEQAASQKRPAPSHNRPTNGMSKKDRAMTIFSNNKSHNRATVIQMFVSQLDMTKAGATTYYYNCSKAA